MAFLKMMTAGSLAHYLVSCLCMGDLFRFPFPSCRFDFVCGEYETVEEARKYNVLSYGIKDIDTGFDSIALCLIADAVGGECGHYIELYDDEKNVSAEDKIWHAIKGTMDYGGYSNLHKEDMLLVEFDEKFSKYHYLRIFENFLDLTEFELKRYGDGYGLIDLQGGNLGNIEEDRFTNAAEIIERMSRYIDDYLAIPIIMDVFNGNERVFNCNEHEYDDYGELARKAISLVKHSCGDDEDILDVLCNHGDEINLDNVLCIMKGEK